MGQRPNPRFSQAPEGQAYCGHCDSYKPTSEFYASKTGYNGLHFYCKLCVKKQSKKYIHERVLSNKEKNYGVSAMQYIEMLEKQGHVCAICGRHETKIHKGTPASYSVDHDHDTGQIRGLLCSTCNSGLGHFFDDIELMRNAINYLMKNNTKSKIRPQDDRRNNESQSETLRRTVRGLPKQNIGNDSDTEDLPLFAMN